MTPSANNPERRETDFSQLPAAPTDFDRTPEDPSAMPSDPAGPRLLLIPAIYIILGAAVGALTDWLSRGHQVTTRSMAFGAGQGIGVGMLLFVAAFIRIRRRERDQRFINQDRRPSDDDDWAGAREVVRKSKPEQAD
jgi:hypothetical protein